MKTLLTIAVSFVGFAQMSQAQDLHVSKNSEVSFFSSTPVEDISALSKTAVSALNIKTGQIYAKVENTSFAFKAKLMEEHFNENYMESEKYPFSLFDGKILEVPVMNQSGTYHVTVVGKLTMHGVTKEYKVPAVLTYQDGKYSAVSTFKVKLVDHNIEVPSLMFSKIAEEIEVKIKSHYQAKQLASSN